MQRISLKKQMKEPIVLALGFFDCVHSGHKSIFDKTVELAKQNNCLAAVFTFDKILRQNLFSFEDRCKLYEDCGLQILIEDKFLNICDLSPLEFINILKKNFDISAIVCGKDYRFGKDAEGDAEFLKDHFKKVYILPLQYFEGEKISTTKIRKLVQAGDFERANKLLTTEYFRGGVVEYGRKEGRNLGARTANIAADPYLIEIGDGVYETKTIIEGVEYPSTTFVGASQTFGVFAKTIETHIKNFNRDVYGTKIEVVFCKKLRENNKFPSVDDLIAQIKRDLGRC